MAEPMEKKHFANKQIERHHERAFGGKETPQEEHMEGGHQSFHVFHHPVHGTHSVHHHEGGRDHADHASPEEALEHGKQVMGGGAPAMPMMEGSEKGDGWGAEE